MYERPAPTTVLKDVAEKLNEKTTSTVVPGPEIRVDRVADTITFANVEVPLTKAGLTSLGDFVDVPTAFLHRLTTRPELQQHLLTELYRGVESVALVYNKGGLLEARDPQKEAVDPRRIVEAVSEVVSLDAPVIEWWKDQREFRLDTIVPEGFDRGIGGEKNRKVGDITRGGVRCGVDFKKGLSPWVAGYMVRLQCLNGMECEDPTLKIDARGNTMDEVMEQFGVLCEAAFGQVEHSIKAFYDLRKEKVEDPLGVLLAIAHENDLAPRFIDHLLTRAKSEDLPDAPTMFDITNLITNEALEPSIANKAITRRNLERIGGNIITEHAARCGHCRTRLTV